MFVLSRASLWRLSRSIAAGVAALAGIALISACGSTSSGAGVPSVGSTSSAAGGQQPGRLQALHAAAQCIRQHGIPDFQDPVLTPNGDVYTDTRSLDRASRTTLQAAQSACGSLVSAANWNPEQQPPPPPALIQAGVRVAQCMRAHGLPTYRDPTASSVFTPGHGFGITPDELPPDVVNYPGGAKSSPIFQAASQACHELLQQEIAASNLSNLGGS